VLVEGQEKMEPGCQTAAAQQTGADYQDLLVQTEVACCSHWRLC
jgi:hypothetical protein